MSQFSVSKIFQNRSSKPVINISFSNISNNGNALIAQSHRNIYGNQNLSSLQGNYFKNNIILSYNNNLIEPGEHLNLIEFEFSVSDFIL